jgi:stage II sporulation protein D
MKRGLLALVAGLLALAYAGADEMSASDKLRILYSHRFTFNRDGLPLITIAVMEGQRQVRLSAEGGMRVLPDGDGGAEMRAGAAWTVTAEETRPARLAWWIVVSRQATDADVAMWRQRGYQPRTFEIGVVFGVEGDVIDSRETLLGVAAEADPAAAGRAAAALGKKWGVETSLHPELVARPEGVLVAREDKGGAVVRNADVIWFAPARADGLVTIDDVVYGGGGATSASKRETRSYHGSVYVTLGADARLTVVNAVAEDQLLAGLVPAEMYPDAPPEALKAQAVAARDELLSRVGTRHFQDPFLLCASQHCQVYAGAGSEDARTTRAVAGTRGEVLLRDGGGGLVPAYYSACCGGATESNENAWATPPDPSLRGSLDALGPGAKALAAFAPGITDANVAAFLAAPAEAAFCGATARSKGRYRWSVRLTAAELDKLVAASYPAVGAVRELTPLARGVSGRITSLRIVGEKGQATVTGELVIRRLLGGLKSSLFLAHAEKSGARITAWVIDGAGFGHGVGMCQLGAIGMADAKYDYKAILGHYYPGSHVRKLY